MQILLNSLVICKHYLSLCHARFSDRLCPVAVDTSVNHPAWNCAGKLKRPPASHAWRTTTPPSRWSELAGCHFYTGSQYALPAATFPIMPSGRSLPSAQWRSQPGVPRRRKEASPPDLLSSRICSVEAAVPRFTGIDAPPQLLCCKP